MLNEFLIASMSNSIDRNQQDALAGEMASRIATDVREKNNAIQFDVEKLFMITEALWEILKFHHGYTDEHLADMIRNIDLRDGKLDGTVAKSSERPACHSCGRTLIRHQAKCLYCGTEAVRKPFDR